MNRKHSFAVRCLALVLALVMILSNANLGLTMRAQAAEVESSLFELIAASDCGTRELNAILGYADALHNLNDETVTYEAAPEKADATLRQGILAANEVNGWVPYTYTAGSTTAEFGGNYEVDLGAETVQATVTYKLDLNKDEDVKAALDLVATLANEAAEQSYALTKIAGNRDTMTALRMLDADTINYDLLPTVDAMTVEQAELDQVDFDEDGDVDEIDRAAAEVYLQEVKVEYRRIITGLLNRFVTSSDRYGSIMKNGRPAYVGQLRVSAIMQEFNKADVGLSDFYLNSADIITEMGSLANTLFELLGERDENGAYANAQVVDTLFVEAGVGAADSVRLGKLANIMAEGAADMRAYTSYKTEIDTTSANLAALCNALVACGAVSEYKSDLCLYTSAMEVLDDTYKFVKITIGETGIPCNFQVETDSVLTEEIVAEIVAYINSVASTYIVDTTAVEALVGTVVAEDIYVTCAVEDVKSFDVFVVFGETVDTIQVRGDAAEFVLQPKVGHETTYIVPGEAEPITLTYPVSKTYTITPAMMAEIILGNYKIEIVDDKNVYFDNLQLLIAELNDALGRADAFVPEINDAGEYTKLTANISLNELKTVAEIFIRNGLNPVQLNGVDFIVDDNGVSLINVQSLVNALLTDSTFTSEKLIKMGRGEENNLLTTTMQVPGYDMAFVMNLTSVPGKMATVSKGLNAVKDYFWFNSNNGQLDVNVNLPEKAYEAYLAAAIGTGYLTNDDAAALNNKAAMLFIADYINTLMADDIDANTFSNTLKAMHIDKDVSDFYDYYSMTRKLVKSEGVTVNIEENYVDCTVKGDKEDLTSMISLLEVLGMDVSDLRDGMKLVADGDISVKSVVNLVNPVPAFNALVIEPGKINDSGIKTKLNTIDYVTDLAAHTATMNGSAVVMLMGDVNGDLNFPGHVILDLNGFTVNGSVSAAGKLVIVDSELATLGGTVTGSVSSNGGAIIGGTFSGANVSSYLRDGYIQDANGSVRNPLYRVEGGNGNYVYVLNAEFYEMYEGYLPSVEALATEIAIDVALNAYPAAGMSYNGKSMYALNLDNLLNNYLGDGIGGAIEAMLVDVTSFINVEGINALANDIIDDLCDLKGLSEALNNETQIGRQYKFASYPATVEFVHNDETNTFDIGFVANTAYPHRYSMGLKVEGDNETYSKIKEMVEDMAKVVIIKADVELIQPEYNPDTNKLTFGGNVYADVTLDLTEDMTYTKVLAVMLAYANEEWADQLVASMGCAIDLNDVISQMTVESVFTTLKDMSRAVSMSEMMAEIGYVEYDAAQMAKMERVFHAVLCGLGKVLEELDVTGNNNPLSVYEREDAVFTYGRRGSADGDVTIRRGLTAVGDVESADVSATIMLAPKCTGLWGDVNSDGTVDIGDASLLQRYCTELCDASALHLCVADVNADGIIDIGDASMIQRFCTELIDRFPAEVR